MENNQAPAQEIARKITLRTCGCTVDAIKAIDKPVRGKITELYDAAKNSLGVNATVDARSVVDNSFDKLQKELLEASKRA